MQRRLVTVILFAILAAAVSSSLLYRIISDRSGGKPKTTRVFVATHDLEAGAMVSASDVRAVDWPAADGSHWMDRQSELVGRALLTPVGKDEPFAESRLAAKGAGAGVASRIPAGMRLIAVHVDELTGLSRFILPGMHVDVISTGATNGPGGQGMVSRTILQNIEVFSTGQTVERDAREKAASVPVFNLLVTPQQALTLSQAVAQSRIELVLRNPLDRANLFPDVAEEPKPNPVPLAKAMDRVFRPAPEPPAAKLEAAPPVPAVSAPLPPPLPTVEVIQGTKRTMSTVTHSESQE